MSKTLTPTLGFADRILERGRRLQTLGLASEAIRMFEKLVSLRALPSRIAAEAHARLSELHGARDDNPSTPRPGGPALRLRLSDAEPTETLAEGRRAVAETPLDPRCRLHLGLHYVRRGRAAQAIPHLRKAATLATDDLATLEEAIDALVDVGRAAEAGKILRDAMFVHSHDRRYRDAHRRFRHRVVSHEQARAQTLAFSDAEPPVLLAFPPAAPAPQPVLKFPRR